jgi:hypothetical protein
MFLGNRIKRKGSSEREGREVWGGWISTRTVLRMGDLKIYKIEK